MPLVLAPAVPWILGAITAAVAGHYVLPGREGREQSIADAGEHIADQITSTMSDANEDADANARPIAIPDTCKDCDEDGNPCLVGPYAEIVGQCSAKGGNAHHIVPDRVYRLSTRPTGALERSTFNRIPGAPSLANGMSVCLSPVQHAAAHTATDPVVTALGSATGGVAPMAAILAASQNGINAVPGLDQGCKAQANRAASNQVRSGTGLLAPGRTSMNPPKVLSEAARLLSRGYFN